MATVAQIHALKVNLTAHLFEAEVVVTGEGQD